MSGAHSDIRSNEYNLTAVRELVLAAFSEWELRQFCLDVPQFRFICEHLGELYSHARLVDTVLRECLRCMMIPELLAEIDRANPRQYEHFSNRLLGPSDPSTLTTLFPGPFQAPPLPAHFVPRPEISDVIRAALLSSTAPGVLAVSAIHGLGGIGKSVLAAALVHDPPVRASFPDGVVWVTLGQQAEVLPRLQEWIQSLGDYQVHATTVDGAAAHLRTLLDDKACLLVVDDVWDHAHAEPFLVGGTRCRMLITTRKADVADELCARLFSLDVMTPEQSLDLFSARLQKPLAGAERQEALRVADAAGHLPLALEMAAARVARGGVTWADLRAQMDAGVGRLEALESAGGRRGQARLKVVLDGSLQALRDEDPEVWQAFLWLGVLAEAVTVSAPAAATVWSTTAVDADDLLEILWAHALLLPSSRVSTGGRFWRGYRLHDLLRARARQLLAASPPCGLGTPLAHAHATVLDRYRARMRDSRWHVLEDDGYIHANLMWHLVQAGREEMLHALLAEETADGHNGWFEACERLAQTATYLTNVSRAWDLASQHDATGLECRYALITVSLNSLAANISPQLLHALVAHTVWTHSQGLAYAHQIPEPGHRAWALATLASCLPAVEVDAALADAMAAARGMEDKEDRVRVLIDLAAHLPEPKKSAVFEEALAVIEAIKYDPPRARAMVALLRCLPEELLGKALSAAQRIGYEPSRAEVLSALASRPRLPQKLLGKLQTAAQCLKSDGPKAQALTALAPHLPQAEKRVVLGEAWAAVRRLDHNMVRILALSALAPHLLEAEMREAQGEALGEALAGARQLQYGPSRAAVLADLAVRLSGPEQAAVWDEALEAAGGIDDERSQAVALANLARHLPQGLLGKALSAAHHISAGPSRAEALSALATGLPEELQGEALAAARHIRDAESKAKALTALAPRLSQAEKHVVLDEALAAVRAIQDVPNRVLALTALAPHLPEAETRAVLGEALAAAQTVRDIPYQDLALAALAPHLPDAEMRAELGEARPVARSVRYRRARAGSLADQEQRTPREAFTMAPDPGVEGHRLLDLRDWALQLGEAERCAAQEKKLMETLGYDNEGLQAEVLAGAVPYLADTLLDRVLEAVRDMKYEAYQATVLIALVPQAPDSLLGQVLEAARGMKYEAYRSTVLSSLVRQPRLPGSLLGQVLEIARNMAQDQYRAALLTALAPRLSERLLGEALTMARHTHQELHRAETLTALAPHLPGALQAEALQAAMELGNQELRADVLCALASRLSVELLSEALHAAQGIEQEESRADVLYALASHLPAELLGEALHAAQGIGHAGPRADVLSALAPQLVARSSSWLRPLWYATLSTLATHTRADLLSDLAALEPVIYALGGQDAIVETTRAVQDVGRWWP